MGLSEHSKSLEWHLKGNIMKHKEISLNTKKALAQSLKESMQRKPFQKISVSELIQSANVNRKTFYYHFEDTYALLKWILEEEVIKAVWRFELPLECETAISFLMDYMEENAAVVRCAYESIGRDVLNRFFYADFHDMLVPVLNRAEQASGKCLDAAYKEFLTVFYMEAFTGMLIDWIQNRDKKDRRTVIEYFIHTMRVSLAGVFENKQSS